MRRTYAVLLTCMMLLFGAAAPARAADPGDYLDEHGDPGHVSIPAGHTIGVDWDAGSTALSGWYAVTGDVIVNHTLYVDGEAHLILCDEASLTVTGDRYYAGIEVTTGDSLTVYAQSTGEDMGRLTAQGGGSGGSGIGGSANKYENPGSGHQDCGTVTINGGQVTATGDEGAGIGGGVGAVGDIIGGPLPAGGGGTVIINGGRVTATSGEGAGIGGGSGGGDVEYIGVVGGTGGGGGTVIINGGAVTATSDSGAAIGGGGGGISYIDSGGTGGEGGAVTILGGTVAATSVSGAAIGGGGGGKGSVYGGGGGGGGGGDGGGVTIRGGTVTASSTNGVGIGGGAGGSGMGGSGSDGGGGSVTITGGSVNAGSIQATPTNGGANVSLTRARLDGVGAVTKVDALTVAGAAGYGAKDLYTDASGVLYLYLPTGAAATQAETADHVYKGSVAAGESEALYDTELSGLALSRGTLDPPFSSGHTDYTATVPYNVEAVAVTPTASDESATIRVNTQIVPSGDESGEILLSVGANRIDVVCTAEDDVTSTAYTVVVTRSGAPVILAQPSDRTVAEGQRASFSVTADGPGALNYQWYVDRGDGRGFVEIDSAGARTATYRTSAVKMRHGGYRYACRISSGQESVRSDPATLTVIEKAAPQTGDGSRLPLWLGLMLLSGLGLMALLAGRRGFIRR